MGREKRIDWCVGAVRRQRDKKGRSRPSQDQDGGTDAEWDELARGSPTSWGSDQSEQRVWVCECLLLRRREGTGRAATRPCSQNRRGRVGVATGGMPGKARNNSTRTASGARRSLRGARE